MIPALVVGKAKFLHIPSYNELLHAYDAASQHASTGDN